MPTHKDFKRLVRSRMRKTGEAYTTARARLLQKKSTARPDRLPRTEVPAVASYASIAGMSDTALREKTGRSWKDWVSALDRVGAATWPHRRIAKYLQEEHEVSGWWSQMVTVGYERVKGLRAIGQRRDGTFEANKSKTFPVPLSRLYRAWSDARLRARWLPGAGIHVRSATPGKYMYITWSDKTSVAVGFTSKGPAKSQVAVQHAKLPDKSAATEIKLYWEERLRELGEMLGARPGQPGK